MEDERFRGLRLGAIGFARKPVDTEGLRATFERVEQFSAHEVRRLLIVDDDPREREILVDLIGNGDVESVRVGTGAAALERIAGGDINAMILDLRLPDMPGGEHRASGGRDAASALPHPRARGDRQGPPGGGSAAARPRRPSPPNRRRPCRVVPRRPIAYTRPKLDLLLETSADARGPARSAAY